jgi:hypothetical protein
VLAKLSTRPGPISLPKLTAPLPNQHTRSDLNATYRGRRVPLQVLNSCLQDLFETQGVSMKKFKAYVKCVAQARYCV